MCKPMGNFAGNLKFKQACPTPPPPSWGLLITKDPAETCHQTAG